MALVDPGKQHPVDEFAGHFHLRLAETPGDVRAAQSLRYRVFCEEMSAQASKEMRQVRREFDRFDEYCDHVLVVDRASGSAKSVVGTYRVMRRQGALNRGGFYSAEEFEIDPILAYDGEILELGRSCVDPDYRTGPILQLLWGAIARYVQYYDIRLLFGCASLPSTDPEKLRLPLCYLHHNHLAPPELRARARPHRRLTMGRLAPAQINRRQALEAIPPLVKGYLRLGGYVGDGAVIDHDFGTTDLCVVVKTDLITEKYLRRYSPAAS